MESRIYNVNLQSGYNTLTYIGISQYDAGVSLEFIIYDGATAASFPAGTTAKIQGVRPSGVGFNIACTLTNNIVTVDTVTDMTGEAGKFPVEIRFESSGVDVGTVNFIFLIEKAPHPDGTIDADITHEQEFIERLEALETNTVTDTTLSIAGRPADAKVTGDAIRDITTDGTNLYNPEQATQGKEINTSGAEVTRAIAYCSDYISVEPSTEYYIAVGMGSSTHLTVAFFNVNKGYISGSYNTSVNGYRVTTPSSCAYIRVNGALTKINDQMVAVYKPGISYTDYKKVINGANNTGVKLISATEICYNGTDGVIQSASNIYLLTPDNQFNLGTSVNVGTTGAYLLWNKKTGSLYTSNSRSVNDPDIYMLAILSASKEYESKKHFCAIDSVFPIFTVDLINNTLSVNVKAQPAYIIYNGVYYTVAKDYTQELTLGNHCFVYFDPVDNAFGVSTSFSPAFLNVGIPVLVRYYRNIYSIAEYETAISDTAYKDIVCYGDSLTWYDGNAFTWGDHAGEICIGYESYILNYLNARSVVNRGESGKTTPQICDKIKTASDLSTKNIMIIMGGDNDDRLGVEVGTLQPVGGTFNTATIYGALQSAIEYALTQNPTLRVVLMTEPVGWTYQDGIMDRVSDLIPNAYRRVAELYGLPLIDLWNNSGINEMTRATYYADPTPPDNTLYMYHPNNIGWVRLSKLIIDGLKDVI